MMRSALSPRIFRRILRNEPIVHRHCPYRQTYNLRNPARPWIHQQRRTIFGWISPVPREAMLATGEKAALTFLKDACSRFDNKIRPPPTDQLMKAWKMFVFERYYRAKPLGDREAVYMTRVLQYLSTLEGFEQTVSFDTLAQAIFCISQKGTRDLDNEAKNAFAALSSAIFQEIQARVERDENLAKPADIPADEGGRKRIDYFDIWLRHIEILSSHSHRGTALEILSSSTIDQAVLEKGWLFLLAQAYAAEGPAKEVEKELEMAQDTIKKRFDPIPVSLSTGLAIACAQQGDFESAKIYAHSTDRILSDENAARIQQIRDLLDACRKHKEVAWGQEIIKAMTKNVAAMRKYPELWTAMFTWALGTGKSADEIHRMMEVMVRTNPMHRPNNDTINSLIRVANEKNDPYLAERLITLGERWGVKPDVETYLLQMDYRLSISDIEGTRTAFDYVKSFGGPEADDSRRINRLIQAMCNKGTYSFESVMDVVDFLGERGGRFEPGTVTALAILHLNREEYRDVADLLSEHVKEFSLAERAEVRTAIFNLMLLPATPLGRVWDSYMIYQHIFEEAPRSERIKVMERFFELDRSDMALHVFTHMRRHASPDINPDVETYVTALVGCGRTKDNESLALIHNVLKLDIHVEESTRLFNAKMIAFFSCGEPDKAQAVWEDIISSSEGPNFNSLLLIFRICEQSDFGEVRARGVWGLLRKMDVPLDNELIGAYVGALAGNGCENEARRVVESSEKELGVPVDEMILGKLFNGTTSTIKQAEIRKWIEQHYPEIWVKLEEKGTQKRWNDTLELPIDIKLEP